MPITVATVGDNVVSVFEVTFSRRSAVQRRRPDPVELRAEFHLAHRGVLIGQPRPDDPVEPKASHTGA